MPRLLTGYLLLFTALLSLPNCDPGPPVAPTPRACNFDAPRMEFSQSADCQPKLTRFTGLDRMSTNPTENLPNLPTACAAKGLSLIAELPASSNGDFVLHVYNGAAHELQIEVFGADSCTDFELIQACTRADLVANRIEVEVPRYFNRFFVRLALGAGLAGELTAGDFIALAAYDRGEPVSTKGMAYNFLVEEGSSTLPLPLTIDDQPKDRLLYNCGGKAFQRLALSGCGIDEDALRQWAALTGLDLSEQYFGPAGNVVMLDVPPGMDLNTAGDGARTMRPKINTGEGTVDPDYVINLFDPQQPTTTGGTVPTILTDPFIRQADLSVGYFQTLLPPFDKPREYNPDSRPLRVSVIDSGVDREGPSVTYWDRHRYEGQETQFVRAGRLGADFIQKDLSPDDLTPHGTYVAGALLGAYRAKNPLQIIHFKVFGEQQQASYFGALVSIYEAIAVGSDVINMSWGITQQEAPAALRCAIERAAANESTYLVTSAGNDGNDLARLPQWPAAFAPDYPERMLTVGSYWYEGRGLSGGRPDPTRNPNYVQRHGFSNYGNPHTSVAAYLTAPVPAYRTSELVYPVGTSFSAPQIAGELLNVVDGNPGSAVATLQALFSTAPSLNQDIYKDYFLPTPDRLPRP